MPQLAPLNPDAHKKLRISRGLNSERIRDQQMLPLVAHEFQSAGCDMPILFVKNAENGQFQVIGLVGLKQGQSLLLKGDEWLGSYMPGLLANDPFGCEISVWNACPPHPSAWPTPLNRPLNFPIASR